MTTPPTGDWRDEIMKNLPDAEVHARYDTFESALEIIKTAAYNRRMTVEAFVGRAALAVAVHDFADEITWEDATNKEPPLRDLRLSARKRVRRRGRGFGPWKIEGMSE